MHIISLHVSDIKALNCDTSYNYINNTGVCIPSALIIKHLTVMQSLICCAHYVCTFIIEVLYLLTYYQLINSVLLYVHNMYKYLYIYIHLRSLVNFVHAVHVLLLL